MSNKQKAISKKGRKTVSYAFIDSQNLNLGVRNDVINSREKLAFVSDIPGVLGKHAPKQRESNKKTRSNGRITSLGQPGHSDTNNVAKKAKKVNPARKRGRS